MYMEVLGLRERVLLWFANQSAVKLTIWILE